LRLSFYPGDDGTGETIMPQYQQLKKGYARVRILPLDATRAYLLLMKTCGGKVQVLPGDIYVLEESQLPVLDENKIQYETIDKK
jgi:hypothetical protein